MLNLAQRTFQTFTQLLVWFAITTPFPSAYASTEQAIRDYLRIFDDGTRILVRLQPKDFGIRHHYGSDGRLIYSVTFRWIEDSENFRTFEPAGSETKTRSLLLDQCGDRLCIYWEGLDGPFIDRAGT